MADRPRPSNLPAKEQPRGRRQPTAEMIAAAAPWLPVPYVRADVVALQALRDGKADAEQQKRILRWLMYQACGTYEMTFHPGPEGARNSDFAQGRRFVGLQVAKLLIINPGAVKAENDNAAPFEPQA